MPTSQRLQSTVAPLRVPNELVEVPKTLASRRSDLGDLTPKSIFFEKIKNFQNVFFKNDSAETVYTDCAGRTTMENNILKIKRIFPD